MTYLGLDYGKKKIGLAISEGEIATPYKIISVSGLDDAVAVVRKIILDEGVDELVVGMPETDNIGVGKFINIICRFVKVVEADETLTSKSALEEMIKLGKGKKARKMEDAYSACLILQEYLNEHRNKEP